MAAVMVMVRPWLPVPPALLAVTVALEVPATVGVPDITPVVLLMVSPDGNPVAPKLVGELVAVMVYVKALPVTPPAVVGLVMTGAGVLMRTVLVCWAFEVPLAAWMVKPNVPAVVGVPFSTPDVALSASPGGRVPATRVQVTGVATVLVKVWV